MQVVFDVVDLLQLQEIWGRRPIIIAYSRLERRTAPDVQADDFSMDGLLPRLARLRQSAAWKNSRIRHDHDPAQTALGDFPHDCLHILYPEVESPQLARHALFASAYNRFVVTRYQGAVEHTVTLLQTLAQARQIEASRYLGADALPVSAGEDWIPADLTDDIRSLDTRYQSDQPGTPAAYVIAEDFWTLLTKTDDAVIQVAAEMFCKAGESGCREQCERQFQEMVAVARTWYRSPSVVGLCYQVE
ncbi:MAG: hypothetical protein H6672_03550 [Anaerolineaceae bacterium]|nr:hypothetical protein [Anaerolineaceae bacterium]